MAVILMKQGVNFMALSMSSLMITYRKDSKEKQYERKINEWKPDIKKGRKGRGKKEN
jgi:hypothetical protein